MPAATTVLDFEITRKVTDLALPDHESALVLFRLHGRPLGWGVSRVTDGRLDGLALLRQFVQQHALSCGLPLAERAVHSGRAPRPLDAAGLLQSPAPGLSSGPVVTVAVRNRTPVCRLRSCLDALERLDYPSLDLLLVDASDDRRAVEALVGESYPRFRYVSAPGQSVATRRAVEQCRGDILALTDGDAVVDARWVSALVQVFLADPEVMTVSGLVLPRVLRRPFRPALPAGAPFARVWWRAREDHDSLGDATEGALERASANIAYWRPGSPAGSRRTRVWEPAAIVRTLSSSPTPRPVTRRGPVREIERGVDLADGLAAIGEMAASDSVRLRVTWSGEPLGTVRIPHRGAALSSLWIGDAIAQQLTWPVLDAGLGLGPHVSRALLTADVTRYVLARWEADRRARPVTDRRTAAA
jgi:hypothetical protein